MPSNNDLSPVLVEPSSPPPLYQTQESSDTSVPSISTLIQGLLPAIPQTNESLVRGEQNTIMNNTATSTESAASTPNETAQPEAASASDTDMEQPEVTTPMDSIETPPQNEETSTPINAEETSSDTTAEQAPPTSETEQIVATEERPADAPPPDAPQDSENDEDSSNVADTTPDWVKYEEDTSVPDEEEMKEIVDSEYDKLSALDVNAMEEQFYTDLEDPEQRPVKKLRLSWVIKGVRGTRDRPNYARVLNSPGAFVDGLYWSIKFYPRGDSCSSLSAFVRCSREPPVVDEECPESDFSYYEGSPDTDFSSVTEPKARTKTLAKDKPKTESKPDKENQAELAEGKKQQDENSAEGTNESLGATPREPDEVQISNQKTKTQDQQSWRVSAQIGMVIYNPAEPRTGHLQSDGHQFSKHCDDWGWVNFAGPWDEIHRRKRGQRQPLLRNDTLGIDAYVRIYDDPTEALWWHESKDESQWPSKELAGYFSMGTPGLYHSPAVAGITSWMLLAPFREILQHVDGGRWRTDSLFNPKPLICQSQLVLDQMRNLSSDCYVNLYRIIEEFLEVDERFNDVKSFWEVFRRGLELELADEPSSLAKMSRIFDADGQPWNIPSLSVPGVHDIQRGLKDFFDSTSFKGTLPNFMPVMLNRSNFDKKLREWKLQHNRVRLNDELDLSEWCTDTDPKYTLYGFIAHVGSRNSGKFYSVLRPGGKGTKWLAFEDGNGNKVFSYSKKRIQEYEGLEGEDLRKVSSSQSRENAYLAMYIRSSCTQTYLPASLEPYKVAKWLKPWTDDPREDDENSQTCQGTVDQSSPEVKKQDEDEIEVEIYLDECAEGCENMLRLHDLRTASIARDICRTVKVAIDKTFKELRSAVAKQFELDDTSKVQMWEIRYQGVGKFSRAILEPISYRRKIAKEAVPGEIFRIWLSIQQPMGENKSYKHLVDRLTELNLAKKTPEEDVTLEDVDAERLAAMTDAAAQELTPTISPATTVGEVDLSIPDVEQASVASAVGTDLEQASVHENQVEAAATPVSVEQSESSEGEDGLMTPTSSARSISLNPQPDTTDPVAESQAETHSLPDDDDAARAVVHGHLIDAAQHANVSITQTSAASGDAVTTTQIVVEEAIAHEESSSASTDNDVAVTQVTIEDQTHTPALPHVARAYGNIQLFDADAQKFIAQRPFHPELESTIGAAVRKQMSYSDERQFRVWRRSGATGTEAVQLDATFIGAGLQDVFTLIVGDALSEAKIDELKAFGKLWQPQQLISYLGNLNRQHPYAASTSEEPVELADFGNDYYRGPLSRGRPHGEQGHLITSTGHSYTGPFVAGEKSGPNGKMVYQNGDTYSGAWSNDERHGQGEYIEKQTGNRYVGGFQNGKRWGQGITYWQVADQQAEMCQICYEEEIDALFYDCGHVCACVVCAKQCDTCPICRRSIRQVVKMFRA